MSDLRDDFPLMSEEELEREERLRPQKKRFAGSTAEWLAGYALVFLAIAIFGMTEIIDWRAAVLIGAAVVVAAAAILVWRREKSRPP
jgi:hypothetical protein